MVRPMINAPSIRINYKEEEIANYEDVQQIIKRGYENLVSPVRGRQVKMHAYSSFVR